MHGLFQRCKDTEYAMEQPAKSNYLRLLFLNMVNQSIIIQYPSNYQMSLASNVEGRIKTFTCSTCDKTFDNQQTLDSHISRDHSVQSESPAGVG